MKVLDQDRQQGRVKVRVDTLDDLWHLSHLVQEGDLVRGVTQRRLETQDDMVRDKSSERVTVTMGITAEDTEFHESTSRLRVQGTIEEAPEEIAKGSHHTISVGEHDWIEIVKPEGWPQHLLDRLSDAVESTHEPRVTVVAMDEQEAAVAVLHQFGAREIGTVNRSGGGKQYDAESGRDAYHAEIRQILETTAPEGCPVAVVGPGFERETFVDHLRERPIDRVGTVVTEATSHAGMNGVQEAIKRGVVERIAESSRVSEETQLVEDLLARIAQDGGLATYGPDEVRHALNMGAVERLLVTDELVKDETVDELLELAQQTGADVTVIGTGHDAGDTLGSLTGIGAILRFDPGQTA